MSLIGIVVVLLVVGVILWAIKQLPFIDATMKKIIYVLVVVVVALWLVSVIFPGIVDIRVPTERVR
jgi:hypothetical protein